MRRTGVRRRVGGITVFVAPGEAECSRAAFVASRAVGPAVRRNRAKRRLREALARVLVRDDRDYVVAASARVVEVPFEDLVEWLERALVEEE